MHHGRGSSLVENAYTDLTVYTRLRLGPSTDPGTCPSRRA